MHIETKAAIDALIAHLVENDFPATDFGATSQSTLADRIDAVMRRYADDRNYIDLMPEFALDVFMVYCQERSDDGDRMLKWLGAVFADLIAFDYNENYV